MASPVGDSPTATGEISRRRRQQLRDHAMLNSNNSATRVYMIPGPAGRGGRPDDTTRVLITSEPDLFLAMRGPLMDDGGCWGDQVVNQPSNLNAISLRHNSAATAAASPTFAAADAFSSSPALAEKLDIILRTLFDDRSFNAKYAYSSLFLIGAGSYGCVFRAVSQAVGTIESPLYDEHYVRFLQTLRRTRSRKRVALLDSYRDSLCLDLVALKIETLNSEDIAYQSANKIQLVKEFWILMELFRCQSSSNALVGFPLPIEFGFLGNQRAARNLKKILVFDTYGRPSNYQDAFLGESSVLNLSPGDVTNTCYMTMELLGPNLDEWKHFFMPTHSQGGRLTFSVQTVLKLMDQVLCRLLVMHRRNMVHLDLKPDNICMGIGKMTNTVYLLDYGLSRVCSDEKPTITMGSRRYMSVGVLNLRPANYMMDIESWFYVLIVLLTDFIPWSDEALISKLGEESINVDCDRRLLQVTLLKKQFWGDEDAGPGDRKLFQRVVDIAESTHRTNVPDIGAILTDIYAHVRRMRLDFYPVSSTRMHADILNEDSDLCKRYHTLRKLLLFPYECDFTEKECCFAQDKDLVRKQTKRQDLYPMLVYTENGRNWCWDWDLWFEELYVEDQEEELEEAGAAAPTDGKSVTSGNSNCRGTGVSGASQSNAAAAATAAIEDLNDEEADQALVPTGGIPDWMRHYLARVLGQLEAGAPVATVAMEAPDDDGQQSESLIVA